MGKPSCFPSFFTLKFLCFCKFLDCIKNNTLSVYKILLLCHSKHNKDKILEQIFMTIEKLISKKRETKPMKYKTEVLTGIRPTGDLTVANYLGAVLPIVEFQKQGMSPMVFIADLHGITDNEPSTIRHYIHGIVADYIALGINP